MIIPGLVSVTFRHLDVPAVVALAAEAGLQSIEWGGDVHVPVGDTASAERARKLTDSAGLRVSSFGSYYRATEDDQPFEPALRTAVALGAPSIRIWAGRLGSADASAAYRRQVTTAIASAADAAAAHDITVSLEFHPDTLTDTVGSTLGLLSGVEQRRVRDGHPVRSYYQPYRATPVDEAISTVRSLRDHLTHVHVFSWDADGRRRPLADRADLWTAVLSELAGDQHEYHAQLEFVTDDDPANFRRDAATLLDWLNQRPHGR